MGYGLERKRSREREERWGERGGEGRGGEVVRGYRKGVERRKKKSKTNIRGRRVFGDDVCSGAAQAPNSDVHASDPSAQLSELSAQLGALNAFSSAFSALLSAQLSVQLSVQVNVLSALLSELSARLSALSAQAIALSAQVSELSAQVNVFNA